ncbi:MAG: PLDc_N domain-containing protein [Candidatus Cloacimonadota bacterium]|nr:MAG: PLDc_N domain-containing protein [Candidatus Cloacimonadota bacterium]
MAMVPFCIVPFIWLIILGLLGLWIWMLIDCIKREEKDFPSMGENTKLIWILIVVLTQWIGAIIYYFMVKQKMDKPSKEKS